MDVYQDCRYEVKNGYVDIHPTESQKVFLLEKLHFLMKTFIKRDIMNKSRIEAVHRLSRIWLELENTNSMTMMSREDIDLIVENTSRHWSIEFMFFITKITKSKIRCDGGLFTLADQTVKSLLDVVNA